MIRLLLIWIILMVIGCGKSEDLNVKVVGFWVGPDPEMKLDEIILVLHPNGVAQYGAKKGVEYTWNLNCEYALNNNKLGIRDQDGTNLFIMEIVSLSQVELKLLADKEFTFKAAGMDKIESLVDSQAKVIQGQSSNKVPAWTP